MESRVIQIAKADSVINGVYLVPTWIHPISLLITMIMLLPLFNTKATEQNTPSDFTHCLHTPGCMCNHRHISINTWTDIPQVISQVITTMIVHLDVLFCWYLLQTLSILSIWINNPQMLVALPNILHCTYWTATGLSTEPGCSYVPFPADLFSALELRLLGLSWF